MVVGMAISILAPIGWLAIQFCRGSSVSHEIIQHPYLYSYLLFGAMFAFGAFGYRLGKREENLEGMALDFARASITDDLTGLFNDAFFQSRLHDEIERHQRQGTTLSLVLLDLDHFKDINDSMGHQTGDVVLSGFGELLEREIRAYDVAGRVGGEEFAVLLPNTTQNEAIDIAERIRRCLWAREFQAVDGSATFHVTASVGVATNHADPDISPADLYQNADEALYAAKEGGRDRVIAFNELQIL
jgi:diguanylate cyclase (GGDEF)-like protein